VSQQKTSLPADADAAALVDIARLALPRDAATAAHLFERALELVPRDDPVRPDLVLELLPPTMWGGRPRVAEEVVRAELGEAGPGRAARLRFHLAASMGLQDRWSDACELWASLLDDPHLGGEERRVARAEHAAALAFVRDLPAARAVARTVMESDDATDDTCRFLALQAQGTCLFLEARPDDATIVAEEMVGLARASNDVTLAWRNPHLFHGVCLVSAGRLQDAAAALETARASARATGALWAAPAYQWFLANLMYRRGDWDAAVSECREGLRFCELNEATWELAGLLGNYAVIEARRGRYAAAERLVAQMDELGYLSHTDRAWRNSAVALVAEGRGDTARAVEHLLASWEEARSLGVFHTLFSIAPDILRVAPRGGELVHEVARELTALAKRPAASPHAEVVAAHARAVATGSPGELQAAMEAEANLESAVYVALASEELAVLWAEQARTRKSLAALRNALRGYSAMGAAADERRARARVRALGVTPPPPRRAPERGPGWAALTQTERTTAQLVAEGLKNREIAERLFVSVSTVQTHLKSIFKKMDLTSRSQLVREVLGDADDRPIAPS
jgi:DNA-binding NarL/FixJ family response regulator